MSDFKWFVSPGFSAYASLADVKLDEAYKRDSACAKAYRVGRKRIAEIFGPKVDMGPPGCAPMSYGHIACLGSSVIFPEDSEPGVTPVFGSIKEGIEALQRDIEFSQNPLFQHYWQTYEYLKKEFPDENVRFSGFAAEGPITTAVLLRGQDFYLDIYDTPDETKAFLNLVTESVIKFQYFIRKLNKESPVSPAGSSLNDDFASLIAPNVWPEFVVPFWNRYYEGLTTGKRNIHVENLRPEHLKYLRQVGIHHYDPSVSSDLSPRIIKERIDIPFMWRLASFDLDRMTGNEVREWVYGSREEGADLVFTILEKNTCQDDNPEKIGIFIESCRELVKQ